VSRERYQTVERGQLKCRGQSVQVIETTGSLAATKVSWIIPHAECILFQLPDYSKRGCDFAWTAFAEASVADAGDLLSAPVKGAEIIILVGTRLECLIGGDVVKTLQQTLQFLEMARAA